MASKSKRSTRTRDSTIHVDDYSLNSTGRVDESSSGQNGSSNRSQSPNHISARQDEKNQLSNLNDRLATYIDTVRRLETENGQLRTHIRELETVEIQQKENFEKQYLSKIGDLRKTVDALTRDKARLQIDIDKAMEENDDLKRDGAIASRQIDVFRRQLEDEVVLRTEIENRLATTKEDLDFARNNHHKQLEEVRRKRQVEMTTISTQLENQYQNKLQEQLQNLRGKNDEKIAQNRADIETMYRNKLDEATANANHNRENSLKAREETSAMRSRNRELEKLAIENSDTIDRLNRRINDHDSLIRHLRDDNDILLKNRDDQIAQLQNEITKMIDDYQDLLDIKVQLDMELQAYHKLLEGEETRLQITPTSSPNTSMNVSSSSGHHVSFADSVGGLLATNLAQDGRRGVKRKRLHDESLTYGNQQARSFKTESNAEGDIVFEEVDTEGKYVRIQNKGAEDVIIGTWTIKYIASELEVKYKFGSRQVLKAGKSATIWSNNAGHEPGPFNMVMKNQSWPTGDASHIELIDTEGEVKAWYTSALDAGKEGDERCKIM